MDAQRVVQELSTALSNDDLWSHPEIVDDVEELADAYDELKAENAKLRALVRDYANAPCQCYRNGVACKYLSEGACTLYDRAIALGVEVH